jgi:hypothetical protein
MGVPGFFSWLLKNKNKLGSKNIINENIEKVKYLMLDTNCLLHPCVNNIIQKYKLGEILIVVNDNTSIREELEKLIWKKIEDYIFELDDDYSLIAFGYCSMYNHVDDNNAEWEILNDNQLVIKASKNIKKGEEIFINYGDNYWKSRKNEKKNDIK